MWLLGAGASVTSGIPTAYDLVWDFKRSIFCTEEKVPLARCRDLTNEALRASIQAHFDRKADAPPRGGAEEYSYYFEYAYPSASDRRTFLDPLVGGASPSHGHLVLAALMKLGKAEILWTTNFDRLVEDASAKAFGTTGKLTVADLEHAELANEALAEGRVPLLVKLHGDFHHRSLKNIETELRNQDEALRRCLVRAFAERGLAIVGYSGRDDSVMSALKEAVSTRDASGGGLYWFHRGDGKPLPSVLELLAEAATCGLAGGLVRIRGFDQLMADVLLLEESLPPDCEELLAAQRPLLSAPELPEPGRGYPALRLNAVPVTALPAQYRLVECRIGGQEEVNAAVEKGGGDVLAARRSFGVLAFGSDSDVRKTFNSFGIRRFDLHAVDLRKVAEQTSELFLLREALLRGLSAGRPLVACERGGSRFLRVDTHAEADGSLDGLRSIVGDLEGRVPDTDVEWYETVRVSLEVRLDKLWLILLPTLWRSEAENNEDDFAAHAFVSSRLNNRYNDVFYRLLDAWLALLFRRSTELEVRALGIADGVDAVFTLSRVTAFSRPEAT